MNGYEWLSATLKALGHPIRLEILAILLREGEACVCHLEGLLGRPQAYISQHLARLREAGLVVDRRDGMNVFYAVADESLATFLDGARGMAETFARSGGMAVGFPRLPHSDPEKCPCPKCRGRIAEPEAEGASTKG